MILETVEVPQVNDLFKVFKVAELISKGARTDGDIATGLDLVAPEGAYYLAAARALRLVRRRSQFGPPEYVLGYLGELYLAAKGGEKKAATMIRGTLSAPHVVYVAERLGLPTPVSVPTPEELRDVAIVEQELVSLGPLSGEKPRRRAATLVAWMKTVDKLARQTK